MLTRKLAASVLSGKPMLSVIILKKEVGTRDKDKLVERRTRMIISTSLVAVETPYSVLPKART